MHLVGYLHSYVQSFGEEGIWKLEIWQTAYDVG